MHLAERKQNIALIGAPVDDGAGREGCRMGPDALRIAGLFSGLRELGHDVSDLGNVVCEETAINVSGTAHNASRIYGWVSALHNQALRAFQAGQIPIFLGGDHSLSMGSVGAAVAYAEQSKRPLHVLWLDAHADFNTPQTSPSGNMHGMSTAYFCGESGFGDMERSFPPLPYQNLHIFGARSIDRHEKERLAIWDVDVCDMRMLDEHGVAKLIRLILHKVQKDNAFLHVSLDVDFLDPSIAPGVGTTVPGGATFREAHLIMEMISETGLMTSLDLVELNPFLDERGKSARLMAELAASAFGKRIFDRRTESA